MDNGADIIRKRALERLDASTRATKRFTIAITAAILAGFLTVAAIFTVFSNVQELAALSRAHAAIWRDLGRTVTYVLGAGEERPVPPGVSEKMQRRVVELFATDGKLDAQIYDLATSTRFFRRLLFTNDREEEIIASADIEKDIRDKIQQFAGALPSVLSVGFSAWSAVDDLKLRSGIAMRPLVEREEVLTNLANRTVSTMWRVFLSIIAFVLAAISFFWFWIVSPSFRKLRSAVIEDAKYAHAIATARREMREREQFLRVLFDNTPGMIVSIDRNFRYTSANRAYLKTFGLNSMDEVVGRTVEEVVGQGMWSKIHKQLSRALDGETVRYEARHDHLQSRFVDIAYVPQRDGDGNTSGVVGLITDVHEQHVAREALRASEESLRATLNSIREAVIVIDERSQVARMNPAAEQMVGYTLTQAIGHPLDQIVKLRDRVTHEPACNVATLATQSASSANMLLLTPSGAMREVSLTAAPIARDARQTNSAVLVLRDMTDENRLRQQINQQERLKGLGQLAGGIAHDFNNMLASVRGAAEILAADAPPRPERDARLLNAIVTTCDRAAQLTERLTRFARHSHNELTAVSVRQLIDEVREIIARTIDRRIVVQVSFAIECDLVRGHLSTLESALLNLCINGAQAMPDGGTLSLSLKNIDIAANDPRVAAFGLTPGRFVEITVADTGVGISEQIIDKIFDPFFTTKAIGEGSGIGLATTYGVVSEHGGAIDVVSQVNNGTRFRMIIPCLENFAASASQPEKPRSVAPPPAGTVLVVEDEPLLRDVLEAMLQALGNKTITAEDGVEAVRLYERRGGEIDIVMMDLNMPRMDGRQAIAELRKLNPQCRAIVITGFVDPIHFDGETLKDVAVLRKPIVLEELSSALAQVWSTGPTPRGGAPS
ncbi:MAG: PAS domain S-box protein [Hyphomicrobiales bacterium]|nr:PAS domain S-box protein [Hyphomicrobiales bacterium]